MAEDILYEEQIMDNGDPKDPLGLRKKTQQKADPLGLRKKMDQRPLQQKMPSIAVKNPRMDYWEFSLGPIEKTEMPTVDYSKAITEPKIVESVQTIPGVEAQKAKAKERTGQRFLEEVQNAQKHLYDELVSNDDVYDKIIRNERGRAAGEAKLDELASGIRSDMPSVQNPMLQFDPKADHEILAAQQTVSPEDISQEKQKVATDEARARNVLEYMQHFKPEKQNAIQSSLYKMDIANQLAEDPNAAKRLPKILQNAKELEKGDLVYNPRNGQLIRPENVIQSFVTGWKESTKAKEEYKKYKNIENNEAIAMDLDYEMQNANPDEPLRMPSGTLANLGSGLGYMPLKSYVAGAIGSLGGPVTGASAAGAVAATDFYKLGWINEFKRTYFELRKQGVERFHAVSEARKLADNAANVDAAVGGLTSIVGLRAALRPIPKAALTQGFRNSVLSGIKGFASGLSPALKEGIAAGGVGAAGEKYKNALAIETGINRDADEHVFEVAEANLLLPLAIGVIAHGAKNITRPAYRNIMQGLHNIPEGVFNNALTEYVSRGTITEEQAASVRNQVQEYGTADKSIPEGVAPEARIKIQDQIQKRNALEKRLETEDKAFHPEIKEKIKAIEEEIVGLSKQKVKASKEEKQISTLIDEALEEGRLQGPMADVAKGDPDGFMKFVADQSLGRNDDGTPSSLGSADYAVRQQYGDAIVDKAIEMFPLAKPKQSSISVIRPQERTQPTEVVTIAPKEQGVPDIPLVMEKGEFKGAFLEGKEKIADGSESTVYRDGDSVVKIGEPYNAPETFDQRVQDAQIINKVLGDGSLELIGTYESANGTKNPIFRQKFVEGEKATPEQIDAFMAEKGFEKKGNGYEGVVDGETYRFTDIDSDNAIVDANGKVTVIDAGVQKKQPIITKEFTINRGRENDAFAAITDIERNVPVETVQEFVKGLTGKESQSKGKSKYYPIEETINDKPVTIRVSDHPHLEENNKGDVYTISIIVNGDKSEGLSIHEAYSEINLKANNKNIEDKLTNIKEHIDEIGAYFKKNKSTKETPVRDMTASERVFFEKGEPLKDIKNTTKGLAVINDVNPIAIDKILQEFEGDYSRASLAQAVIKRAKQKYEPATYDQIETIKNAKNPKEVLDIIVKTTTDESLKRVAKVFLQNIDKAPFLKFKIAPPKDPYGYPVMDALGSYAGGEINISKRAFTTRNNAYLPSGLDGGYKTALHEFTHAFTIDAYRKPKTSYEKQFKKYIDETYSDLKRNSEFKDNYGFKSPEEFLAEVLSNPEFRLVAPIYKSNLIDKVIEFIAKIFGYTKDKNLATDLRLQQMKEAFEYILTAIPNIRAGKGKEIYYADAGEISRLSEAYHKYKKEGTHPEFVKRIEDLFESHKKYKPTQDAVQIESPDAVPVREQSDISGTMGKGIPKPEEPTGESGQDKGKTKSEEKVKTEYEPNWVFGEEGGEVTGITHEQMNQTARELGLPEYEGDPETVAGWDFEANKRIQNNPNAIPELLNKLRDGKMPDAIEQRMMLRYMADLKARINKDPMNDGLLAAWKQARNLSDIVGGREVGKSLRARQGTVPVEETLADYMMRQQEVSQVGKLTEKQKETNIREFEEFQKAKKNWDAYNEKRIDELATQKAEAKLKELKAEAGKSPKQKRDYTQERKEIFQSIQDKLKKSRGEASATVVPYAKELFAIAPDVAKLVKNLVEQGVDKLPDLIKAVHDELKDFIKDIKPEDIRALIAGEYNEKGRTRSEIAAKIKDLRDEASLIGRLQSLEAGVEPKNDRAQMKRNKEIEELKEKLRNHDLTKLAAAKSRMKAEIAKLEADLAAGRYASEERAEIKLDKQGQALKDKLIELRRLREIRLAEEEYAQRSMREKIWSYISAPFREVRTLRSSFDLSAPLRQGVVPTAAEIVTNPARAGKRFANMLKSAASEKYFNRWMSELKDSPFWGIMEKSGLSISEPGNITKKEEVFQSQLAQKIPIIGTHGIKGSERAYSFWLNAQRVDLFRRGAEIMQDKGMTFENSPDAYKHWASTVNALTGRGELAGPLKNAAEALSIGFFSPRLIASRLSFFNPLFYKNIPAPLRKMVVGNLLKFIGLGTSVLMLSKLAGADVEEDPRSPDFGKIRTGDTRYDIWGGFQQYIRLFSQLATQSKKMSSGKIESLQSEKEGDTKNKSGAVIGTFLRSKAAPLMGSLINVATGEDVVGQPVTLSSEAKRFLLPILWEDVYKAAKDDGVKGALATAIPGIVGVGVQTYPAPPPKKSSSRKRQPRIKRKPRTQNR